MNIHNQTIDLGNGREITIETGRLAKQAHGSVVVRSGDTMLLATIVSSHEADGRGLPSFDGRLPREVRSRRSFPWRFSSSREARPSDTEVLVMRLVDRALRPMFPGDYHAGTQVLIQLMSADAEVLPTAWRVRSECSHCCF